jgi:hypothetical protein
MQEFDRRLARAAPPAGGRLVPGVAEQGRESAPEARAMIGVAGGVFCHQKLLWDGRGARQAARQRPSR